MTKPADEIMDLVEKLHEGKMLDNPMIKSLVNRGLRTGDWEPFREHIERLPYLEELAEQNINQECVGKLDNPFRPFPLREDVQKYLSGPIKLGYVNDFDDMFGLHWDLFCLLTLIPGRVRSGKSQLMKYILCQLLKKPRSFNIIIPDLKGEYRDLLSITKLQKVLLNRMIRINPLVPAPWLTPDEHINLFSKIFVSENWLGATSKKIVSSIVEDLYRSRGIYDGSQNYPTMRDLEKSVLNELDSQRSFKYRDILLLLQNRLDSYSRSENFNCRLGIPYEVWLTENLVLEMGTGFEDEMYCFIISFILGLQYTHNMKKGLVGTKLRTLWNIDEARILLAANRDTSAYGETYFNETITKVPEFGLGMILASPESASFNQTVRSISYTKICFPLTDGSDRDFVAKSFGLDDEQSDFVFKLPRFGQAIVRYGGYERPFLLGVPHFRLKRHLTDEEVESRMVDFYRDLEAKIRRPEPQPLQVSETVPPDATTLLFNLSRAPFTKVSEMTKFSAFASPEGVAKARTWLSDHGFIELQEYRISKRGRKSMFAALTAKAYSYLGEKPPAGKGGFEHRLYQDIICGWLNKNGVKAKIEAPIRKGSAKTCDVLASSGEGLRAWEVTIHFETLLQNLHEDLAEGAQEVVVVTRDQEAMDKAIRMVSGDERLSPLLDRISFATMNDFFD